MLNIWHFCTNEFKRVVDKCNKHFVYTYACKLLDFYVIFCKRFVYCWAVEICMQVWVISGLWLYIYMIFITQNNSLTCPCSIWFSWFNRNIRAQIKFHSNFNTIYLLIFSQSRHNQDDLILDEPHKWSHITPIAELVHWKYRYSSLTLQHL